MKEQKLDPASVGPSLYSQLSSRVGTDEGAIYNYSIQLRFGRFGPRFILPASSRVGLVYPPSIPRELGLVYSPGVLESLE